MLFGLIGKRCFIVIVTLNSSASKINSWIHTSFYVGALGLGSFLFRIYSACVNRECRILLFSMMKFYYICQSTEFMIRLHNSDHEPECKYLEKPSFLVHFFLSMMITKHLCFCIYMMTLVNFCYSENLFKNNVFFTPEVNDLSVMFTHLSWIPDVKICWERFQNSYLRIAVYAWLLTTQISSCSCKFIFFCKDINLGNPSIFCEINYFAKATHLKKKLSLFFHDNDWRNGCKI